MKLSTRTGVRQGIIAFHRRHLEKSKTLEPLYLRETSLLAAGLVGLFWHGSCISQG
jgi:hypothetical protein